MKALIIKSLSNKPEVIDVPAGKSVKKVFKDVDFENAVVLINGIKKSPDTIIKENDIVTLRLIPADLRETEWWVATFIIPFGFIIQPIEIAAEAQKEADKAEKELEKIKKLTNSNIDNRPFLRGATNTIATGKSQPYLCGRNFITPYLFSKSYYKISGTDGQQQDVYNILECGFKDIVFHKLGIGDITIKEFSGTVPQNGTFTISGTPFADGVVEIKQNGELFETLPELNYKVVSNIANKEIARNSEVQSGDAEHVVFDLDPHAKSVDVAIKFPYGLYAYNEDNDRISTQCEIIPEYSLDGGSTYTAFTFPGGNTFNRNTTHELRFVAHHDFTLSDYETLNENEKSCIIVRVRSNGNKSDKIKNDCYLYYYQCGIFDPQKSSAPAGVLNDSGEAGLVSCLNVENRERALSCVIGIRLTATKNNEDKLNQINFIATSTARTWNGEEWSEGKEPTRNPAAIALEVLTSDVHPASRYDDSEIDLESFGTLYDFCEDNDLTFDYVITQNTKKSDTLSKIISVCNAALYKDIYGRWAVAIDQAQENSLAVYTPQNIISITNKKSFTRRIDAIRVKYTDSNKDTYKENTYTVTRLDENGQPVTINENSIIKEVDAPGITRHEQIVKFARRLMAVDELRQITTTLKIGYEGVYYTPFSKISIQDPSLNRDASDNFVDTVSYQGGFLRRIVLKKPVTIDPTKTYGIIINCITSTGAKPLPLKVDGEGTTNELYITTEYSQAEAIQPEPGNILSFGELDVDGEFSKVVHDFIISRISRTSEGFSLELQEYNEAIYETGEIPAYKPIVNNTPTLSPEEIPIDAVTSEQLEERIDGINTDSVQAAVDTITHGTPYSSIYKVRPVETTLEEIIARLDDDAKNASASISISEDEILLQVENTAKGLVGLIDIQAGAVTALVEGGGASGQMQLSINLPPMIDAATRTRLINASSLAKVNAVYGLVENTDYYGIKPGASTATLQALFDDLVTEGLLASQIDLRATNIKLDADSVYIDGDVIVNNQNKIKAAMIDVANLVAEKVEIKNGGYIKSANYDSTDPNTSGMYIDTNGNAIFNGELSVSGQTEIGGSLTVNGNANFGTDCYFYGKLRTPSVNTEEMTLSKSFTQINVENYSLIQNVIKFPYSGTYNGQPITSLSLSYSREDPEYDYQYPYNWICTIYCTTTCTINGVSYSNRQGYQGTALTQDQARKVAENAANQSIPVVNISFTLTGEFEVVTLPTLPTYDPSIKGALFQDNSGIVHVSNG